MSPATPHIYAIVPAAGSGQRMRVASNSDFAKQYLSLSGRTILEHSLSTLLAEERIQHIVVSLAPDDECWPKLVCANHPKIVSTHGGETRAQSVLNGLHVLESTVNDHDWVLVHDAARPCFNQALLNRLISELIDDQVGGILAVKAKDTLKMSDANNRTQQTLDRSNVWQAQTPQMFRYGLLKNALEYALANKVEITDEASAIEHAGYSVKLVEGDSRNLKVTTIDDLALAEFLLNNR